MLALVSRFGAWLPLGPFLDPLLSGGGSFGSLCWALALGRFWGPRFCFAGSAKSRGGGPPALWLSLGWSPGPVPLALAAYVRGGLRSLCSFVKVGEAGGPPRLYLQHYSYPLL